MADSSGSPPKPWEKAASSSGPAPFKPPSPGSTSDAVEASGTAKPGEIVASTNRNMGVNTNALARPVPNRPWEPPQPTYGTPYGGYSSGLNYNSGYGSGMYGGGSYGAGMYGGGGGLYGNNNMYRGVYGGGMYNGGMYNNGMGVGGYGMGGPYGGDQDPNNPYGPPSSPPSFWVSLMRVMQGVVTFFGRIAVLIDQNTQAFHLFMSALLQLFDRSGVLYGELAGFVLRLLGVKRKPKKPHPPAPLNPQGGQHFIEGPKPGGGPSGAWDSVWGTH